MTYKVLITDPLSEEGLLPLRNADNIDIQIATDLTYDDLLESIQDADALLVRSQTEVTREVIEHAKQLKVIGRAGVGVDNIDLDAATEYGVIVVNAPNGNVNSAAEHTMAMLMALARKIPQAYMSLKNGRWDRSSHMGVEVKDKVLGIIGLGRIGTEVAYRAKGQRMNVIAYDPFFTEEKAEAMGISFGTYEEVLQTADFITVHTPLLQETHHLINAEAFAMMKETAQIINCARGGIIDEEALYEALIRNKIAGAALDVFENEPIEHHPLLQLDQVIATPHLGGSTVEAQENVAIDVSHDVVNILSGGLAKNPVNIPSIPQEVLQEIEPYFDLAEKLGSFLARLESDTFEELHISYAGAFHDIDVTPLTRNMVKGLLQRHLGERVNNVNASYLAEKKGLSIHEHKTSSSKGFTNLLTVEVKTTTGKRRVSGTLLNGLGARIVQVDDYSMDVVPEGHMLFISHKDQPGAIGRVGMILAEEQINIATMQVGRKQEGGDAIMVLTIDKPISEQTIQHIHELSDIYRLTAIDM
ncbi:MAG TPA: phosphoglycerate dehydrogenase [Virgibacillus sp.]|nr:phosphoglycerate dehydrogenase [Virgibacillus sp.]